MECLQETYFNPKNHTGFLAYRFKTVNRTGKPSKKMKVEEKSVTVSDKVGNIAQSFSKQEIEKKLDFLSSADPKTKQDEIIQAMVDTFAHRQEHRDTVTTEFPRFFDTPSLVRFYRLMMFNINCLIF